jgi:inner membrane protein
VGFNHFEAHSAMRFPLLAKAAAIGGIVFLLTLVLVRIDWLVDERKSYQAQAAQSVSATLAGAQTLVGPFLQRHCTERWEVEVNEDDKKRYLKNETRDFTLTVPPTALNGRIKEGEQLQTQPRYRGLFKVNSYGGSFTLDASWNGLDGLVANRQQKNSTLECSAIYMVVALSDVRGVHKVVVQLNGTAAVVKGGTFSPAWPQGFHIVLPDNAVASPQAPLRASVSMDLVGTQRLAFVPAADQSEFVLKSDWPHPSFGGRFLPVSRKVSAQGFEARWVATAVSSTAAEGLKAGLRACAPGAAEHVAVSGERGCLDTMEVSFFDPVNPYSLTDRATKYALLFIVLTFAGVALTEVVSRRRVHPVQYTLVGLALALFYLLLLSLSEHIAFAEAYVAASASCVLLLGYYGAHILGRAVSGALFGAGMAGLYAFLWVLLQAEQTSLAIGSVLLFAVLAAVMVATRRIDWYALFDNAASAAKPKPTAGFEQRMTPGEKGVA